MGWSFHQFTSLFSQSIRLNSVMTSASYQGGWEIPCICSNAKENGLLITLTDLCFTLIHRFVQITKWGSSLKTSQSSTHVYYYYYYFKW